MKRVISLLIALSFLLVPMYTSAANEVFVGINNVMLPLDNAMPFYSNGAWYIDYLDFTRGDLGISASYNKDLGTAVLYNWDVTLVFNVGKGTAYKEGGTQYNQRSFFRNGTVYVPAAFVSEQFGVTFSHISEVNTLRFRTTSSMSDTMFTYIAKNRIPDLLAAYKMSQSAASQDNSPPVIQPGNDTNTGSENDIKNNVVYITVNIKSSEKLNEIATVLTNYNLPATLFISKDAMKDDNLVRRLCSSRNSIGIFANSTGEASLANDFLFAIAKRKTRLLRADGKLTDAEVNGYRQWGASLDARSRNAAQTNNMLNTRNNTVLLFDDSEASIARLKSVLAHINKQKFVVRTIDIMTNPIAP
ncbi:MAG: hypothetical protein IKU84_05245 [Clostridia bacterium]|nr:hypothetical protein [Clostridia bacterium]